MPAILIVGNFAYRLLNNGLVEHMKVDLTQFENHNFGSETSPEDRNMSEWEDGIVRQYLFALHPYFAEKLPSTGLAVSSEAPDPNAPAGTHDR
jgi:hypothetical protein